MQLFLLFWSPPRGKRGEPKKQRAPQGVRCPQVQKWGTRQKHTSRKFVVGGPIETRAEFEASRGIPGQEAWHRSPCLGVDSVIMKSPKTLTVQVSSSSGSVGTNGPTTRSDSSGSPGHGGGGRGLKTIKCVSVIDSASFNSAEPPHPSGAPGGPSASVGEFTPGAS